MTGRIIQISESIKQEIAERVVEQAHPGYSSEYMGEWYVVNGTRVQHKQRNAPWAPWSDAADVISVEELVFLYGGAEQDRADFDPTPSDDLSENEDEAERMGYESAVAFALDYVPASYDAADYEARYERD